MMKKKFLALLLVMTGIMTMGCSSKKEEPVKMTAEELVEKMQTAANDTTHFSADMFMELDLNIGVKADGQEMTLDMEMFYDATTMTSIENPYKSYTAGEMELSMLGQSYAISSENYITIEDGEVVTYTYISENDIWNRQPSGMSETEYLQMNSTGINAEGFINAKEMELSNKTTKIGGNEVYVLNMTYTGEQMQEVFEQMSSSGLLDESTTGLDGIDFEHLTIPAKCYVDTDTYLLVGVEMEVEGMDELFNNLYSSLLGEMDESTEISVEIPTFYIELSNMEYDEVTIPDVPQEAKDSAYELE